MTRDVSTSLGMTIFAIETSCDETAVAILRGDELLVSEVASQIAAHEPYGGVVPEVASRNHLLHAPRLLERAMKSAGISVQEVDAFAATAGPGLASSLMIGASIAKGLALGCRKPYVAINHLEGHLLSPFFGSEVEANVSLVVSGGHTLLVDVRGVNDYRVLGGTVDDAAGEAFDKVAKMLGLGYPGGPEIERRAQGGDPTRFDLPRSMLDSRDHNFSFSGLKTAVRYLLPKLDGDFTDDLCASFQQAVVDVLIQKTLRAAREVRVKIVTLSGGVSRNWHLREKLSAACERSGLKLVSAAPELCTDNAAMIAFAAAQRLRLGITSSVSDEIDPNLALV
ncbi:MAG: tRNA (adenosine(37)-N6)-threonylcarbamoyltransferase complex transferase subunit TsaD [Verrucomicrobiota bacterium]|nr:tRNA (adenosine(37)-N6)-threonylcarbamoyltransferase complex transferase subunit TsaD [Verrucomicrobiota bacterium]